MFTLNFSKTKTVVKPPTNFANVYSGDRLNTNSVVRLRRTGLFGHRLPQMFNLLYLLFRIKSRLESKIGVGVKPLNCGLFFIFP